MLNRGRATLPTIDWSKQFAEMYQYFCGHHPENSLRQGRGLQLHFFKILKEKFPDMKDPVLHIVNRVFNRFRVRTINKIERQKRIKKLMKKNKDPKQDAANKNSKDSKKKTARKFPITPRGRVHLATR